MQIKVLEKMTCVPWGRIFAAHWLYKHLVPLRPMVRSVFMCFPFTSLFGVLEAGPAIEPESSLHHGITLTFSRMLHSFEN